MERIAYRETNWKGCWRTACSSARLRCKTSRTYLGIACKWICSENTSIEALRSFPFSNSIYIHVSHNELVKVNNFFFFKRALRTIYRASQRLCMDQQRNRGVLLKYVHRQGSNSCSSPTHAFPEVSLLFFVKSDSQTPFSSGISKPRNPFPCHPIHWLKGG